MCIELEKLTFISDFWTILEYWALLLARCDNVLFVGREIYF